MNALFGKDEMECWQWPALPSGQTLCQWWRPCTDRGNSVIIIVITIIVVVIVIIINIVVILVIAVKIIARNHRQLVISFIWRIQRSNCIHATHCNQHSSRYVCNAQKWYFGWPNQNSNTTFIVQTFPKYGPCDFYLVNLSLLGAILAIFQFCGFSGLFWPFFPCK